MNRPSRRALFRPWLLVWSAISLLGGARATAGDAPKLPGVLQVASADEPGTRLILTGHLHDAQGRPVAGAEIHVYQTDATGRYTTDKPMDEPHARLAGFLRTDAAGRFELHTIRPGGYPKAVRLGDRDRQIPPHIHLDITATGHAERRLQLVFADDPLLTDPYWADWVAKLKQPVVTVRLSTGGETGEVDIMLE